MEGMHSGGLRLMLGLALALASCQEPPVTTPDDGVTALQFQDVPVPAGMTLRERFHRSTSHVSGTFRRGDFVYAGTVAIPEVSAYLQERMPQHAWELDRHVVGEDGSEELRFRRGRYVVDCNLRKSETDGTVMTVAYRTTLNPDH